MSLFLPLKLFVVVVFLVMFLRRPSVTWGVGLVTVTSAVLLDTFLGTFNRQEMEAQLGFFYFVIGGALFGGAAVWLWGLLQPLTGAQPGVTTVPRRTTTATSAVPLPPPPADSGDSTFDRQLVYEEIRTRFGREDVLDLMFDLGINENEVMVLNGNMNDVILNVMDTAESRGQAGTLALAVERILTPPPPEHLPRLEKISADSPPTVLRQYLLAHYTLAELRRAAEQLGIDWEQLAGESKKGKVRSLLLYLYRHSRIEALITWMHAQAPQGNRQSG